MVPAGSVQGGYQESIILRIIRSFFHRIIPSMIFLTIVISVLVSMSVVASENPVLKVATSEYPPYEYVENGELVGEDTEIIRAVISEMGYQPEFHVLPWTRAEANVREGDMALVYSLTYSEQRAGHYYFTDPINTARDVLFKRKESEISWNTLDDLDGLEIGLSAAYSYAPEFMDWLASSNAEKIVITQEKPELTGLRMLAFSRIDLFICEESVCHFLLERYRHQYPELDRVEPAGGMVGKERAFRAAFSREHPKGEQLRDQFNQALRKVKDNN